MTDALLRLGENRSARKLLKTLGLPLPLPAPLRRSVGAWEPSPLANRCLAVSLSPELLPLSARLSDAGARLTESSTDALDGVVLDATQVAAPEELRCLYDLLNPAVAHMNPSGRVVVLGRPPAASPGAISAATQSALEGFVRSLAKELGKRGSTAQLVRVAHGAETGLEALLRFLLSARSAFISGQVLSLEAPLGSPNAPLFVRPLAGKVALITGAARGIGEATARRFAAEGAHVVCLDRPDAGGALQELAAAIGGSALAFDLTDPAAPRAIASSIRFDYGGIDIVVHNAGLTRDKTLARMTGPQWDEVIDVNLAAVLRLEDALSELQREGGRTICLASIAGIAGTVGQTNYAAAKAGLIGYVRRRAPALAPRGVTLNAVAPGLIETRLTAAMPVMVREAGRRLSALAQGGEPRDVAEAIVFLASPGAAGLTGSVLRVCGGAFLGA
jgi:3-oxoacyl-[acyl-carrier protein] reductase